MKVISLILAPTGTYGDMPYRPYTAMIPNDAQMNAVAHCTKNGERLDPGAMSQVASILLRPGKHAVKPVPIIGGWGCRRMRFLLVLAVGKSKQILTGYTDYDGVSENGFIDPNMRLYFNRSIMMKDQDGVIAFDAAHVLRDPANVTSYQQTLAHTLRPQDVLERMGGQRVIDSLEQGLTDLRATFLSNTLKLSDLHNCIPGVYLSRLAQAYQSAANDGIEQEPDFLAAMQVAARSVREPTIAEDHFLSAAIAATELQAAGYMTYSELLGMPLDWDNGHIAVVTGNARLHVAGTTEDWTGTQVPFQAATLLGQAIPAIMASNGLGSVTVGATNRTASGEYVTSMSTAVPLCGHRGSDNVEGFLHDLRTLVLPHLSYMEGVKRKISFSGVFDLTADSKIDIQISGPVPLTFCMPSFADGLFAPVLGADERSLASLAKFIAPKLEYISGFDI